MDNEEYTLVNPREIILEMKEYWLSDEKIGYILWIHRVTVAGIKNKSKPSMKHKLIKLYKYKYLETIKEDIKKLSMIYKVELHDILDYLLSQ